MILMRAGIPQLLLLEGRMRGLLPRLLLAMLMLHLRLTLLSWFRRGMNSRLRHRLNNDRLLRCGLRHRLHNSPFDRMWHNRLRQGQRHRLSNRSFFSPISMRLNASG